MTDDTDDIQSFLPVIIRDTRTEYVTKTVNVNRAPTDESVRLLKEFEEKARDKIIESVHIGNTTFECVVQMWWDAASDDTAMRAVFKLNGKQQSVEHRYRVKPGQIPGQAKEDAWIGLRDKIATTIAGEMIASAFASMGRKP